MRLDRERLDSEARLARKAAGKLADLAHHSSLTDPAVLEQKRAAIEAALARARARRPLA
jgi:electron transport complex protein RnfB